MSAGCFNFIPRFRDTHREIPPSLAWKRVFYPLSFIVFLPIDIIRATHIRHPSCSFLSNSRDALLSSPNLTRISLLQKDNAICALRAVVFSQLLRSNALYSWKHNLEEPSHQAGMDPRLGTILFISS